MKHLKQSLKNTASSVKQAAVSTFLTLTTARIALVAGSGVVFPGASFAQDGLGTTFKKASTELATGVSAGAKVGFAAIGFLAVGYSIIAISYLRKKDEREYPLGQSILIGIAGAILLSVMAFLGLLSTTVFSSDQSGDGAQLIFQ